MAFLDAHPGLGYPAAAGLGLLVGSFLNVVILRLPRRLEWQWKRDSREILGEPELYDPPPPGIVVERSHCPHCKAALSWYENIPVLSWLALRGRCRHCGTPISMQYPLVELLTSLLFVACVWRFGFGWKGFGAMLLTSFLIALSGIDLRTQLRHLPRRASQLSSGMFSYQDSWCPQCGQCERSTTMPGGGGSYSSGSSSTSRASRFHCHSSLRGRRRITTLRKLPTSSPSPATAG